LTESLKGGEKGNEESAAEMISSASKHENLGQVPAALELDIFFSEDYFGKILKPMRFGFFLKTNF